MMGGTLTENAVHVWYCYCDDPAVSSKQQDHLSLLATEEIARYKKFAFEKDRRLFLAAHALLRTTLSRYAAVAPAAWRFETTDKGKPFLPVDSNIPPLEFNVSHSEQLAVCAVTLRNPVGVDVESTTRRADPNVARYFLSPSEMSRFQEAEDEARHELFYRYWTLKESYAKALGMGLSMRFPEFSFLLNRQSHPTIVFEAGDCEPAATWQFHQQTISPHYFLAVAVQCPTHERPDFVIGCAPPDMP